MSGTSAERGGAPDSAAKAPSRITLRNVLIAAVSQVVIGLVIIHFTRPLALGAIAQAAVPTLQGAGIGLAIGVAMAVAQIAGINASQSWRRFLQQAIGTTPLSAAHIIAIGIIVGIAEELLFRAAIQPLAGITVTSLIFAVVHWNYAALRGGREALAFSALAFALVFATSVVLGHLYEAFGLGAAIVAHAAYDIVALFRYRSLARTEVAR